MSEPRVIFHPLVQKDLERVLKYYSDEVGLNLADRFFTLFLQVVNQAVLNPHYFHPVNATQRRANLPGFPYHFLYRITKYGIRVNVLRHDRQKPDYGLRRK
ncbi:MAG: type II toxin-antitoxin system RelE/ParE family toxin [Luteolibacter sp.]